MSFGAPHWFWALAVLPVLALLYFRAEKRSAAKLEKFISARLLPELAGNVDRVRRTLRFFCVLLALGLAIVALAKPRWGYVYEEVRRRGLDLLLAVDTSRSMLSNDVSPNRLERVKLATQDLINSLEGDRVGLIAFAGRAFLQAPLTIDYDAVVESINDLDTKTIPEGGTNISEAIALATQTFGKTATGNRALVIFTDGEELSGDAMDAARKAADDGIRIFTIGVGTLQGSLIPIQLENGAEFVKDAKGQVVKSHLDEKRLREIATATQGIYLHLENGPQTMRQLISDGLSKMKAAEFDARPSRRPIERYQWPLGAAIVALIASLFINDRKRTRAPIRGKTKSGALVAASLLLLASGSFGADGLDLYNQGKYEDAYAQFQNDIQHNYNPADIAKMQFDAGTAAYKLKQYEKALEAFSQSLANPNARMQENSHYNLGKTLEEKADLAPSKESAIQELENAAQHYEGALKLNPKNEAAAAGLRDVREKIARLKQKPPPTPTPPPQQNQQDKKKQDDQQNQDGQGQSDQQKKDNQKSPQDQNQQKQQNSNGGKSDQQQQKQNSQSDGSDKQQEQKNSNKDKNKSPSPSPSASSSPTPSPAPTPSPSASAGKSPSPSPSASPSQSPTPTPGGDQQKNENRGKGESPTPGTNSPTPANNGSPGNQNGKPSPAPSGSPSKPLSGELKAANQQNQKEREAAVADAEAEKRGELSPKQAEALLRSMKDEEAHVQLDEHRPVHPVYNDW